jgi:hypothetical protein
MGIYFGTKILGIRIMQLTEYGFTLEVEKDEGEGCMKLVEKYRNQTNFQIQAKYGITSTYDRNSESETMWVPLKEK